MFSSYSEALRPHALFGHKKTSDRFIKTISTLGENFGKSIPLSASDKREKEAIYNLLNSSRVKHEYILLAERDRVIAQIDNNPPSTYYAIGDVTELTYTSTNRVAAKTGRIISKNHVGFNVLSQLMCDSNGVSMGLLSQDCWNYEESELGQRKSRQHLPIEEKETGYYLSQFRNLQDCFKHQTSSTFFFMFDRAGDVHEILQARSYAHIHYLIRSKNDRKLLDKDQTIRELLDEVGSCGCYQLDVKLTSSQKLSFLESKNQTGKDSTTIRKANLSVSFAKTTIRASNNSKKRPLQPVELYVVRAREENPPAGVEPIEWVLLTSFPVENFEDALKVIDFYTIRWQIEVYHNILKQGAQIEKLQFDEPDALKNAIGTYSIIAAQILLLRAASDKNQETPIENFGYPKDDNKTLATYLNARNKLKLEVNKDHVTIAEFAYLISVLGGNHNRKKVGIKSLWYGLKDFRIIKDTVAAFSNPPP